MDQEKAALFLSLRSISIFFFPSVVDWHFECRYLREPRMVCSDKPNHEIHIRLKVSSESETIERCDTRYAFLVDIYTVYWIEIQRYPMPIGIFWSKHCGVSRKFLSGAIRTIVPYSSRSFVVIGEWSDPSCSLSLSSYFLERGILTYFLTYMRQKHGRFICVQILQTLNILFENIRHETSLCKCPSSCPERERPSMFCHSRLSAIQ